MHLYQLIKYKPFFQLGFLMIVLLCLTEFIIRVSLGLFNYSVTVKADVQNVSIRYVPVLLSPNIREITMTVSYEFKNFKYIIAMSERLTDMRSKYLEDSDLYRKISTAISSKSNIDLVINPLQPSKPMLYPELPKIRFYTYPLALIFGIFLFAFSFGSNQDEFS
jgi:hypothetical protein